MEQRIRILLNGSLRPDKDGPLIARLARDYNKTAEAFGAKHAWKSLLRSIEWHRKCRKVIGCNRHELIFDVNSELNLDALTED